MFLLAVSLFIILSFIVWLWLTVDDAKKEAFHVAPKSGEPILYKSDPVVDEEEK